MVRHFQCNFVRQSSQWFSTVPPTGSVAALLADSSLRFEQRSNGGALQIIVGERRDIRANSRPASEFPAICSFGSVAERIAISAAGD
jgi:hypothetical protein